LNRRVQHSRRKAGAKERLRLSSNDTFFFFTVDDLRFVRFVSFLSFPTSLVQLDFDAFRRPFDG
jgi:hypothetical protein